MISLLGELPECNRVLVQWVFVHMGHVIANEKINKMTLQNVSIVLSPTMRISHRVLNCIFSLHAALFSNVKLSRYIPPISLISNLPDSPQAIEEEMRKQESLLAELHAEISSGVVVGKAREEQLWEQQRIVTQLKRNLRHAKTKQPGAQPELDYEEELNFALQTPEDVEEPPPKQESSETGVAGVMSSPEETGDQEHRVTVQIHRDNNTKNVTVIQLNSAPAAVGPSTTSLPSLTPSTQATSSSQSTIQSSVVAPSVLPAAPPVSSKSASSQSTSKVISLPSVVQLPKSSSASLSAPSIKSTTMATPSSSVSSAASGVRVTPAVATDATDSTDTPEESSQVSQVSFSSPILPKKSISVPHQQPAPTNQKSKIPLLPPPPPSSKPKTHNRTNSRSVSPLVKYSKVSIFLSGRELRSQEEPYYHLQTRSSSPRAYLGAFLLTVLLLTR